MDYPVADFGKDHSIIVSDNNTKNAEKTLGHQWNPTKNADGTWNVP